MPRNGSHWLAKPPMGYGLDAGHPHARNLSCWWLANEGSGPGTFDLSPWGNAGLLSSTGAAWSTDQKGPSVTLTGASGRVGCNPARGLPVAATNAWSVEVWASMKSTSSLAGVFGFGSEPFIGGSPQAGTERGFLQFSGGNNDIYFWGSSADWATGVAWKTDGLPHQYMFTNDGIAAGPVYLYVDGVLAATGNPGASLINCTAPYVVWAGARHNSGGATFGGKFISGRVWSANVGKLAASLYQDPYAAVLRPTSARFFAKPAATSYTLSGPSSGTVNAASTDFTVTPLGGPYTGTVTPHSTGSGTFTPSSLTFSASSSAQTFTYTPSSTSGSPHTVTTTASPALGSDPAGVAYTVNPVLATSYTLAGPSAGPVNAASTPFTVTPVGGVYTGTITPHTSGAGAFTPSSLSWSAESAAKTFTYTPTTVSGSPHAVSATAAPALGTDPAAVPYSVTESGVWAVNVWPDAVYPVPNWPEKVWPRTR